MNQKPVPLPRDAHEFIEMLAVTLKPGTCRNYKEGLRQFYRFLATQHCTPKHVTRKHLTRWFAELSRRRLSAATRSMRITCVRTYLYWLHEQGLLAISPQELIRSSDIPRRPTYLPRPLPPEADIELQQRLGRSEDPLQKALFLMRNTGIRSGELRSLPYHCVRTDLRNNSFLKVPLGKLNNERLVPLDEKTLALIEDLQAQGAFPRTFLLEQASKKIDYNRLRLALRKAACGIITPESITTHRLRHTYATTLLTYGVSLQGIMRLLGHRDFNMTLRYADVTLGSVRKEFFDALSQSEKAYRLPSQSQPEEFDAVRTLSDLITWLNKARAPAKPPIKTQAQLLIRRLTRSKNDLQRLIQSFRTDSLEKLAG